MASGSSSPQVLVTVTTLSGDIAYGPAKLDRTSTVLELKASFEPAKPKRLLSGNQILKDDDTLEVFPEEVLLTVGYCSEIEVEVSGSWFGHDSYVPPVHNAELERNVWKLDGVSWLTCGADVTLPVGAWKVGFRVKRLPHMRISAKVVMQIDKEEFKRISLEDEIEETGQWTILEVGTWSKGGQVKVQMHGEDCSSPGQGSKSGLLIDRLVAVAV